MSCISIKCRGRCPICNSDNIKRGAIHMGFHSMGYEFICLDCGTESFEWFDLAYINTTAWIEDEK